MFAGALAPQSGTQAVSSEDNPWTSSEGMRPMGPPIAMAPGPKAPQMGLPTGGQAAAEPPLAPPILRAANQVEPPSLTVPHLLCAQSYQLLHLHRPCTSVFTRGQLDLHLVSVKLWPRVGTIQRDFYPTSPMFSSLPLPPLRSFEDLNHARGVVNTLACAQEGFSHSS